jgi:hypothetical protein
VRARSPVGAKYDTAIDRESAFELLSKRTAEAREEEPPQKPGRAKKTDAKEGGWTGAAKDMVFGTGRRQGMLEAFAKSAMRNVGGQLGRSILRGMFGSMRR